jgi:hypothetical protein
VSAGSHCNTDHILIADVPSLNSGRGGKGTTSYQKLHNSLLGQYLCILSAITEIKVKNKKIKNK